MNNEHPNRLNTRYLMLITVGVCLVLGVLLSINADNWGILALLLGLGVVFSVFVTSAEDI